MAAWHGYSKIAQALCKAGAMTGLKNEVIHFESWLCGNFHSMDISNVQRMARLLFILPALEVSLIVFGTFLKQVH